MGHRTSPAPNHGVGPDLAVVPIIINTGAALFPTIMAFLANLAAVVFNPKALSEFLRRRWRLVAAVTASLAVIVFAGLPLLRSAPASRNAARAGVQTANQQINWSKVAEELIAQEKLHETTSAIAAVTLPAPAPTDIVPVAPATAAPPNKPMQDYSRSHSDGGMSPAGLTPLWSFQPEEDFSSACLRSPANESTSPPTKRISAGTRACWQAGLRHRKATSGR